MLGLNLPKQAVGLEQRLPAAASSSQVFQGGAVSLPQHLPVSPFSSLLLHVCSQLERKSKLYSCLVWTAQVFRREERIGFFSGTLDSLLIMGSC